MDSKKRKQQWKYRRSDEKIEADKKMDRENKRKRASDRTEYKIEMDFVTLNSATIKSNRLRLWFWSLLSLISPTSKTVTFRAQSQRVS